MGFDSTVSPVEERVHARYPFVADVMINGLGVEGFSQNVSMGGMFVNTHGRVEIDKIVSLTVQPEGIPPFELHGRVVYVKTGIGFGCTFTRMSEPAESRLAYWLHRGGGGLSAISGMVGW